MEEICVNIEEVKPVSPKHSTNHAGARSLYLAVAVFLCVSLFARLIILAVLYGNSGAELSAVKHNLTVFLQTSNNILSSVTEERDLLNSKLTKMTEERDLLNSKLTKMNEELEELKRLSEQNKVCPASWKMFSGSCYFLSQESGSWDKGRQDCRNKGADLVVIDSSKEQTFLSDFIKTQTWIGLNDRDNEGIWKWVDGTPLTLNNWNAHQPDNGGGILEFGEEHCVHIRNDDNTWNDRSCASSLPWVCEKIP